MATAEFEYVPVTSQKQDPAWKHCEMFSNGDKVQLKCVYCGKCFRGGGIHRIKEHLAGHKGNAATCLSVPPDVRAMMQESLDGLLLRKRKKPNHGDNVANDSNGDHSYSNSVLAGGNMENSGNQSDGFVNDGLHLTVMSGDDRHPGLSVMTEKRRRGRPKSTSVNARGGASQAFVITNNPGVERVNDQLYTAISRFLYDIGAPLDAVNSVYFKPMVEAIASSGPVVVTPSYHDLRGWVLKTMVEEVKNDVQKVTVEWGRTGCSVLVDESNTENGRVFLSFMVSSPEGTTFLKFVDATSAINSPDNLHELLKQAVEEVGVSHVVQVIINGREDHYIDARKRLMETFPTLYCLSCSACCLDSILEDFGKLVWINDIIAKAKSITRFVYNHSVVLNMMRRYTFGNDVIGVGVTRKGTDFTTLMRMVDLKHGLQAMVTSQEWLDSPYSRQPEGEAMLDVITDKSFWSSCELIIKLTSPLLRVSRILSRKKRPATGYILAGMYLAKEAIKRELVNRNEYMVFWNIIDSRWKQQWDYPLHAAGFFLNPKFFYSCQGEILSKMQSRVFDCVERLVSDTSVQDKIAKELISYKNAAGDFGRNMAVRARDTINPAEWWSTYGGSCPNLAHLAIRILSQTCSSSGAIRDCPIPFERVYDVKNYLEQQRLRDLLFVQYNLRLRQREYEEKEEDIMDHFSTHGVKKGVEEWISGRDGEYEGSHWVLLDQVSGNPLPPGSLNDEVEELNGGFDDYEIFDSMIERDVTVEGTQQKEI
ncbi:PREDICTED: uncharacterized protein LOC104816585 [Tarenaya hassleriana]|uniref:uncharacterized protein LOC104816585 n=1 Tax=Tarenaya hassleriana TaxID=28532 RepID=UPI00053C0CAE|nr:PREDICTED: uncharacterized protein LOC104816585 [Tarenaya hassleriana]